MGSLGTFAKKGVYFVGIGGVSMSALAQLLHAQGIPVRGCDVRENHFTRKLRALGIPVVIGTDAPREETIVYTEAADAHAALLRRAEEEGKTVLSRAVFLGLLARTFPHVLSVAGCHGKTSSTAMLAHIFLQAGLPFTCHLGGEDVCFGNVCRTGGEYLITEACEFRRSFLSLESDTAVILNTDLDHTDCYRGRAELLEAYRAFAAKARRVVVNADDAEAQKIPHTLSFGLYAGDVRAEKLCAEEERYTFTVTEHGVPVVRISLGVTGKMQVSNALAAYCAARLAGLTPAAIRTGLESAKGVRRRFERAGTMGGIPVVLDYAHHPAELAATLSAAQKICRGTVRVVFQPHTYTRTRDLMEDFVRVLKRAEDPVIYRTYAAREPFFFEGSAPALVSRIPEAIYCQTPADLKRRVIQLSREDDLILALGAGDIDAIVRGLLDQTSTGTPFCSQA